MSKPITTNDLTLFDVAEYLKTDADIAEYLRQILEDGDSAELIDALGHVARARGMTEIAKASGITREALRADAQPRFETVAKVCRALGVRLVAQPVGPSHVAGGAAA